MELANEYNQVFNPPGIHKLTSSLSSLLQQHFPLLLQSSLMLTSVREGTQSNNQSRPTSAQPTLRNVEDTQEEDSQPHREPSSPKPTSHRTRPRRESSVSHVDVSFFDPEGVQELRRTLTRRSVQESLGNVSTDSTLAPKDGEPFDLAKTLRRIVQKCAHFIISLRLC